VTTVGLVSLVGAGPGDPDLLTRKGAQRLAEADLVLYDALVTPEILALAGRARRFPVGKRAGRASIRQETINALLVRAARRGLRVVRLKCGDPFVLGRGGEEALALAAAGIPFEVVPGVTTAVAAPALAGIPVTHRGVASGFVVLSGHAEEAYGPAIDSIAPRSLTLVVLMGLASRAALAARLEGRGWPSDTPVAVLFAASTPDAYAWRGALGQLGNAPLPEGDLPGTIVVGEVVGLAARIVSSDLADGRDLADVAQAR
jgi:uroporphyrin-III C-methyltransferase / precorrin-2 dehydrogenase / sirohydrochlorin ferrochelatase